MSSDDFGKASETRRATLSAVATEASVSVSTVSKVLNGRGGVSDDTRAKIKSLLHNHGYARRNQDAAPLVEVVFSLIDNVWAIETIVGVERVAREAGLSVVLTQSGDRHSPGQDWIDGVTRRRPVGVILMFSDLPPEHKQQLEVRGIPIVIIDPAGNPAPDVASVGTANWSGGHSATQHLIDLGHRDIAIITGPDDMLCSAARLSGHRAALDGAGLSCPLEYVCPGEFHYEDGLKAGRRLLSLAHPPTAIFAGNDLQAIGIYEAAREHGVAIPDDLSVVGFDDLKITQWTGPPLTTVRAQLTEMAEEATRLVLRLREGPVDNPRIYLGTRLVVRSSTAPPRDSDKLSPVATAK